MMLKRSVKHPAFGQFSQALMQDVNAANGITDIKAAKKEAKKNK